MEANREELKRLMMKVQVESEKVGLKFNIQKRRSWHLVPSLMANGETMETVTYYFLGLQNHCRWRLQP